jgi:ABC-type multidrug transport system fused ATPase/permease subunit
MTPLFLIVMGVVGILFIALQRYFSRSTIQLKRIEAVSRSPVYNHFGETLLGLATIRAFKHSERFCFTKVQRIDRMTHSFFTLRCVLNWASLRVGAINAVLLAFAVLFVVLAKGSLDPGSAALAVYFILGIGPLLGFFVSSLTELDNNMNAVERVHQYSETLEHEASWDKNEVEVPESWPSEGKIVLKDVVFRYRKNLDPVLHGVSAEINSMEKIGVAGRTGSGKSSLMLCLFRMYEIDSGSIFIDGIDIGKIGLHTLRKKLGIIPQDAFVFSGTIRENLDPFRVCTDEEVWEALAGVQLDTLTKTMGGLAAVIKEYGENLSAGQRQLLCIARAVLRKPKILVMDEATSSVDSNTDTMIQTMVRSAFKNSTTVTIAHRLNTIMDCDRVMVLKDGNLVEFDQPQALVSSGGVFSIMHHAMTHGQR